MSPGGGFLVVGRDIGDSARLGSSVLEHAETARACICSTLLSNRITGVRLINYTMKRQRPDTC